MKTFAVMPGRIAVKVRTGDTIETFEFKTKRRADVKILQLISEGYTLDATHETMTLAARLTTHQRGAAHTAPKETRQ